MAAPAQTATAGLDRLLQFGDHTIPYSVRSGPDAWDELADRLGDLAADRFALVVSEGVPKVFLERMTSCLRAAARQDDGAVIILRVPDGEVSKTPAAVLDMAVAMFRGKATRQSVVIGFGGGKAANMAGMLAGLVLRGIRLVQVPTTWLNLWDGAGVSLKQAVNLLDEAPDGETYSALGKNLVGLFKAPEFVFGLTDVLAGLPADEIRSALGEVIKSVIAISPEQIPVLADLLRPGAGYTVEELVQIAGICVDAKQSVMRHDPHETGDGLACEWGHTCGHVIELKWHLRHGLAILIGCLIATRVAVELGYVDPAAEQLLEDLARRAGAPIMLPPGPPDEELLTVLRLDNKRGYLPALPGHIDMVLLEGLGMVRRTDGVPIIQVPEDVVLKAFRSRISAAERAS
jgi:3-dehydroquinate synthetase